MKIVIVDYGLCNLGSVKRAFEENGGDVIISTNPTDLDIASHIVLPGVGAFPDAMKNLKETGMADAIRKNVLEYNVPFLGICLGMQLMCSKGNEVSITDGLDLIQGEVIRFNGNANIRIPHIGWNEVSFSSESYLFQGIPSGTDFYFVHSFHCNNISEVNVIATTHYGYSFVSVISHQNVFGVQFHPEKSSKAGFRLIKNFIDVG